ncbi:MAG: hypothetical protein UX51_C0051G0011, partial [Candidatus Azambacteria bacterium GW2011_GWF2_46_32]
KKLPVVSFSFFFKNTGIKTPPFNCYEFTNPYEYTNKDLGFQDSYIRTNLYIYKLRHFSLFSNLPSSQQMQMQMINQLSAASPDVENQFVAGLSKTKILRDFLGH